MYKCDSCNYTSSKFFGVCPKCRNGVGEECAPPSTSTLNNAKSGPNMEAVEICIRRVDPNLPIAVAKRKTQYQGFNAVLSSSKGFVEGQVILLGASPGVGKSTLCMSISDENTLYISSEENFDQVNARALRVNPKCNVSIMNSTSIDQVMHAIQTTDAELIIVDSLNSLEFGVGYLTVAKYAHMITKAIKDSKKMGIIISQVAKNGEISGMNSIVHVVDTVLHLERSEISSNIIATSSKNRYGEIGAVAIFKHLENGFEEIDVDHMNAKNEIGATYTETRFGHKNMMIAIEALVAEAQSSFGIRKSNGYNQNRLMQLIGVLSYFGKINFTTKDIYVAISNGLSTDDISVELAMANSILSSYYNKSIVSTAYGEIRLNGKIVNGTMDGEPINHINDLISRYRKQ